MSNTKNKIAIVGGGQLGKMLCLAASNWSVETIVLNPSSDCPAAAVCTQFVQGDLNDFDTIYQFGKQADIITIEIEHVNTAALLQLKKEGKTIIPDPEALEIIKDKGLQKLHYKKHNIPSSPFTLFKNKAEIIEAIEQGKISTPFVQKSRTEGYDGRGVVVIKDDSNLDKNLLEGDSLIEHLISLKKELAVIVAKNEKGDVKCFPPVEMAFNDESNLVETLICPAQISDDLAKQAEELAIKTIDSFGMRGILAVEMFLDEQDNLLINEVAPRPHNSGHHTIESSTTSQYEQLIRTLFNYPLGSTKIITSAVMINLLGALNYSGAVKYQGLIDILNIEGVKLHIYGKQITNPNRKMGHVTVLDNKIENALEKAALVKKYFKIIS